MMRRSSVPNGPCFPELTTPGVFVNEEAGEEAEEDEDDDENDSSGPWWKEGDLLPPSPESTRARRIALDVRYQGPTLAPRTNQESSSSSASQCTWAADLTAKYSSVSSHSVSASVKFDISASVLLCVSPSPSLSPCSSLCPCASMSLPFPAPGYPSVPFSASLSPPPVCLYVAFAHCLLNSAWLKCSIFNLPVMRISLPLGLGGCISPRVS
ncbi:uncharacterized protein LOC116666016 isoform X1 [Camelus ferus]|uniref:Uncharacterized protein LOC116666016 isoform X1 n=1 Tax=Camelus ferus TaxID=419612 RepID=A0A8B8TNJ3_CAMFR|nr:uncharacterized protein LOC116666016 isoform X1 [Camelus ferus]